MFEKFFPEDTNTSDDIIYKFIDYLHLPSQIRRRAMLNNLSNANVSPANAQVISNRVTNHLREFIFPNNKESLNEYFVFKLIEYYFYEFSYSGVNTYFNKVYVNLPKFDNNLFVETYINKNLYNNAFWSDIQKTYNLDLNGSIQVMLLVTKELNMLNAYNALNAVKTKFNH